MINYRESGFTLIEIAIVLIIVTVLLGYTMAMVPLQQELKQYRQADAEMNRIISSLYAFAQVNGRLPCPDTSAGAGTINGVEDRIGLTACEAYFGFLPRTTLGLGGDIAANGTLLDPWGGSYGYHVSDVDAGGNGSIDLVTANEIQLEGMANVIPDLVVCDDSDNSSAINTACAGVGPVGVGATNVVTGIAAIVISLGKDIGRVASNIQDENTDDFHDGTNDKVYTHSSRNDSAGNQYDDLVKWISPNLLYSKMIEADQLP